MVEVTVSVEVRYLAHDQPEWVTQAQASTDAERLTLSRVFAVSHRPAIKELFAG